MRAWQVLTTTVCLLAQLASSRAVHEDQQGDGSGRPPADDQPKNDPEIQRSCGDTSGTSDARTIGYWQASSYNRSGCQNPTPENINHSYLSHANYAFAVVGEDHRIASTRSEDPELYTRLTNAKEYTPNLKVFISVRALALDGRLWSEMVATAAGRATFIESVRRFMDTFAFDGLDLYWEDVPNMPSIVSNKDATNTLALAEELSYAFRGVRQISFAIPATNAYLEAFDLPRIAQYVDWFNLMNPTEGIFSKASDESSGVKLLPHSDITALSDMITKLVKSGVKPRQIVMGISLYGRSFELEDADCTEPGCPARGNGRSDDCLRKPGLLSRSEIIQILNKTEGVANIKPKAAIKEILNMTSDASKLDEEAAVKYLVWDNEWISYDDEHTLEIKKRFANDRCLYGTALWAVDLDAPEAYFAAAYIIAMKDSRILKQTGLNPRSLVSRDFSRNLAKQYDGQYNVILSECAPEPQCPMGYYSIGSAYGVWSQFDVFADGCEFSPRRSRGFDHRVICLPDNVHASNCQWIGEPPFCGAGCPTGSVQLALNNGPPTTWPPQQCYPYSWSAFCCEDVQWNDNLRLCDNYDVGPKLLHAGGPGAVRAEDVASNVALRMAQAGGARDVQELSREGGVLENYEVCKHVQREMFASHTESHTSND